MANDACVKIIKENYPNEFDKPATTADPQIFKFIKGYQNNLNEIKTEVKEAQIKYEDVEAQNRKD